MIRKMTDKTKILITAKEPSLEFLTRKNGNNHINTLPNQDKERIIQAKFNYYENLNSLRRNLDKFNSFEYEIKRRTATEKFEAYSLSDFLEADIILSFGGDGEAIDIARNISKKKLGNHNPLLWIEKADMYSVGALASNNNFSYEDKVKILFEKKYRIENWSRAKGEIYEQDKLVAHDLALNEVAFGDLYMMGMARYILKQNNKEEYQRSSGGMISTKTGILGWLINVPSRNYETQKRDDWRINNALKGTNENFEDKLLEYRIMNPRLLNQYKLTQGYVKETEKIIIESQMFSDGVVTFDGSKPHYENSRCHDFNVGRRLEVFVSDEPLRVIRFLSR